MFELKVVSSFSAAHYLRGYKGKCENLHGHNWKVEVVVSNKELDSIGIVIDFKKLKEAAENVLKEIDHKCLNDISPFDEKNPSSENIAVYVYNRLEEILKDKNCSLRSVSIWEQDNSQAVYYGEE